MYGNLIIKKIGSLFNCLRTVYTKYITLPNLHNGFDFLVCVENINYAEGTGKRRRNYPKHTDIETDLVNKKNENPELYRKLYDLIDDVYNCKDISSEEISKLTFTTGYSAEHILKVLNVSS